MTNRTRRLLLAPGATIRAPRVFGPLARPAKAGEPQLCVCGIRFTRYWPHRQTTHHARYVRAIRHAGRHAARLERMHDKAAA